MNPSKKLLGVLTVLLLCARLEAFLTGTLTTSTTAPSLSSGRGGAVLSHLSRTPINSKARATAPALLWTRGGQVTRSSRALRMTAETADKVAASDLEGREFQARSRSNPLIR